MQPNLTIATDSLALLGQVLSMRKQQSAQGLSSIRQNIALLLKQLGSLRQEKNLSTADLPVEIFQQRVNHFREQLREASNLRQKLADMQVQEQQSIKDLIGISAQEKVVEQLLWEAEMQVSKGNGSAATCEFDPSILPNSFAIQSDPAVPVLSTASTRLENYFMNQGYIVAFKMKESCCQLDFFLTRDRCRLALKIKISKQNDVELLLHAYDKADGFTLTQRRELGQIFQGLGLRRVKFSTEFHDTSRAQPDFA